PRPLVSTPLPYTTLFRSSLHIGNDRHEHAERRHRLGGPARRERNAGIMTRTKTIFAAVLGGLLLLAAGVAFAPSAAAASLEEVRSEEHTSELQSRENLEC